jgi:transposase InsO family protein
MPKKRHTAEQIIGKLREAEVLLSQGRTTPEVCKQIGISEQKMRDELLNREVFYTLDEAKVLVERWRQEYNRIRPHSALGYRPPAPEAIEPPPPGFATLRLPEVAAGLT